MKRISLSLSLLLTALLFLPFAHLSATQMVHRQKKEKAQILSLRDKVKKGLEKRDYSAALIKAALKDMDRETLKIKGSLLWSQRKQDKLAKELIEKYAQQIDEKRKEVSRRYEEMDPADRVVSSVIDYCYGSQFETPKDLDRIIEAEHGYEKRPFFIGRGFLFAARPFDGVVAALETAYKVATGKPVTKLKVETNRVTGSILRGWAKEDSTAIMTFSVIAALAVATVSLAPALASSVGGLLGGLVFLGTAAAAATAYGAARAAGLGHWSAMLIGVICFIVSFHGFVELAKRYKNKSLKEYGGQQEDDNYDADLNDNLDEQGNEQKQQEEDQEPEKLLSKKRNSRKKYPRKKKRKAESFLTRIRAKVARLL